MTEDEDLFGRGRSEKDSTILDAATSIGRTAEERWLMFQSVQRVVAAAWTGLTEDEMRRRLELADRLEPRPDPWWMDVRPEALP